jgi:hypothetical protein
VAQGQPWQKVRETDLKKNLVMVLYICIPSYMGDVGRKITVQARLGKKM